MKRPFNRKKLGSAQETVLRMCNPEYPVQTLDSKTLRTLYSLEDRGFAYRNFGVWRLTAEGVAARESLEREDAA